MLANQLSLPECSSGHAHACTFASIEAAASHKIDCLCTTIDPRPSIYKPPWHDHYLIGGSDKIKLIWWVGLTFWTTKVTELFLIVRLTWKGYPFRPSQLNNYYVSQLCAQFLCRDRWLLTIIIASVSSRSQLRKMAWYTLSAHASIAPRIWKSGFVGVFLSVYRPALASRSTCFQTLACLMPSQ